MTTTPDRSRRTASTRSIHATASLTSGRPECRDSSASSSSSKHEDMKGRKGRKGRKRAAESRCPFSLAAERKNQIEFSVNSVSSAVIFISRI